MVQGSVIHNDTFDILGAQQKLQADFAFDPSRRENAGFAVSTAIYYQQQFAARDLGLNASWADIEVRVWQPHRHRGLASSCTQQGK
jgi:hypothetical protein